MGLIDDSMMPMLDTFIFESTGLLDRLDEILLEAESNKGLGEDEIAEIFRAMHTIKGSAAMMGLADISETTHRAEDMFFIIREDPSKMDAANTPVIFNILFQVSDFLRAEMIDLQADPEGYQGGDPTQLIQAIQQEMGVLKGEAPPPAVEEKQPATKAEAPAAQVPQTPSSGGQVHTYRVFFHPDSQMENIRAFMLVNTLKDYGEILETLPATPESNPDALRQIVDEGFVFTIRCMDDAGVIRDAIEADTNVAGYEEITGETEPGTEASPAQDTPPEALPRQTPAALREEAASPKQAQGKPAAQNRAPGKQSLISVNQAKIDSLVDIMGEIVIAESMVAANPDLDGLQLDNFQKSVRQLRKLTDQMQDIVMSIRMVPLAGTFQKMGRIVRDMNQNLGKQAQLVTAGGETEVDKTIIDALADPLMHMIRNSMDHGIEPPEERIALGKPQQGAITLKAGGLGSDILITVEDDGQGLDKEKLLDKAERNGILAKPRAEYTDREAYLLIMSAGFSTTDTVTEYSGRGVGMDVVKKNIEQLGGTVAVDSVLGEGTRFSIKIPLTLAIVAGMKVGVGQDIFTVPITSIAQIYKLSDETQLLHDTDGAELVMIRGIAYPIIRLHQLYDIDTPITCLEDGLLIIVESGEAQACIFADRLIGEQQVVVKSFPKFFDRYNTKGMGFSGCTIMGDGSISLILDINSLLGRYRSETGSAVHIVN